MSTKQEDLIDFLESYDFMKLGQAVNRCQWNSAMMILQRLEAKVQKLEVHSMIQPLKGIRIAILGRNVGQAKQALSVIVTKRVALIKQIKEMK